ncbi:MAG: hypothetical protein GXO65_00360 [Euryarchaeota archaeon]|nr:hypothetical protein [Euryarchaeota archaeon]
MAKILDFFIDHKNYDYNKNEVARYIGLNRMTVTRNWKVLEENEFIKPVRKIANAVQYALNLDNPVVKKLLEFDWELTKYRSLKIADKELAEERLAVPRKAAEEKA